MQLADEVLRQRHFSRRRLLGHHLQAHVARLHLVEVAQFALAAHPAEEQQQLRLPVGQRVALNVVAVVVILHRKFPAQPALVVLRQRLQRLPLPVNLFYLRHLIS